MSFVYTGILLVLHGDSCVHFVDNRIVYRLIGAGGDPMNDEAAMIWVLDEFSDALRRKSLTAVRKQDDWNAKWGRKPCVTFATTVEGLQAMVDRASERLEKANREVKNAERRLRKCQRWLAGGWKAKP